MSSLYNSAFFNAFNFLFSLEVRVNFRTYLYLHYFVFTANCREVIEAASQKKAFFCGRSNPFDWWTSSTCLEKEKIELNLLCKKVISYLFSITSLSTLRRRAAFPSGLRPPTATSTPTSWAPGRSATRPSSRWRWRMSTRRQSSPRHSSRWWCQRTPGRGRPSEGFQRTTRTPQTAP